MISIQDSYNLWSSTYDFDQNKTRDLDAHATRQMLGGRPVGITLEIGCGTGKNTGFLSEISEQVIGLDFSTGMLWIAQEKFKSPHVSFCTADLQQSWPLASGQVDRVVCNLVLEHIADLRSIFAETGRVLRTGGEFYVSELHPYRQYQGVKANFSSADGQVEIQAFVHAVSDFVQTGKVNEFRIQELQEWWDTEDRGKPPKLITFLFTK